MEEVGDEEELDVYCGNTLVLLFWCCSLAVFNLLVPELFFLILAHSVYKMWIIQEPNKLDLWNKLHFEKEKTESIFHV